MTKYYDLTINVTYQRYVNIRYFMKQTNNNYLRNNEYNAMLTSVITLIKNLAQNVGDLRELREDLCGDLILV